MLALMQYFGSRYLQQHFPFVRFDRCPFDVIVPPFNKMNSFYFNSPSPRLDLIQFDYFIHLRIFKILRAISMQLALSLLLKYDVFDPARRFWLLPPSVAETVWLH